MAAVVLDPRAHTGLREHFEVVLGPYPEPLGLEQLALALQLGQPLLQLRLDRRDGALDRLVPGHVVGVGEDDNVFQLVAHLAGHDVERHDPLERVAEELQADRRLLVGRVDLDRVPPGPERAADEVHVVAVVLELDDAAE